MPLYSRIELSEEETDKIPGLKKIIEDYLIAKTSFVALSSDLKTQKNIWKPHQSYVAIKVPTVEGEELWLLERAIQSDYEKSIGFSKPCDIIFEFRT